MGFFQDVGGFFEDIANSLTQAQPLALLKRGAVAFSTGGLSEFQRRVAPQYTPLVERTIIGATGAIAAPFTGGLSTLAASAALSGNRRTALPALQATRAITTLAPPAPPIQLKGVQPMGLDLGSILGTVGNLFGGVSANPFVQGAGQILQSVAPAFTPAAAYGPVYSPAAVPMVMPSRPGLAASRNLITAGSMVASMVAPILFKIASTLGRRNISLSGAVNVVRKMSKIFTSPEAIAVYLGITISELASLITSHAAKKRRHMNPANGKALRRAARRIKGFHRMCGTIDLLKTRGRGRSRSSYCGTCHKNPCRC